MEFFDGDSELSVLLLTTLYSSAIFTATFWSYELFLCGGNETVVLFNTINFSDSASEIVYLSDNNKMGPRRIPVWKHMKYLLILMVTNVTDKMKSIVKCLNSTRSSSDMLLILCPFATMLYLYPFTWHCWSSSRNWKAFST